MPEPIPEQYPNTIHLPDMRLTAASGRQVYLTDVTLAVTGGDCRIHAAVLWEHKGEPSAADLASLEKAINALVRKYTPGLEGSGTFTHDVMPDVETAKRVAQYARAGGKVGHA